MGGGGKRAKTFTFYLSTKQVHTHTHHHSGQLPPGEAQTRETHKDM